MRLGAPLFGDTSAPDTWTRELKRKGYRAAFCPLKPETSDAEVEAYVRAAGEADIVIAEVGAWSNPLSPDEATRNAALEKCKAALALADRVGARCCVNIAGSRGDKWDGPCSADLTAETFDMIVASVREIIDAVKPRQSFYALETMPWMYPDSAESYLRLITAIDRETMGTLTLTEMASYIRPTTVRTQSIPCSPTSRPIGRRGRRHRARRPRES